MCNPAVGEAGRGMEKGTPSRKIKEENPVGQL